MLCSLRFGPAATLGLGGVGAVGADAGEEGGGGFVGGVLRDQFAPERLGEDRSFQTVEQFAGADGFGFEAVGAGEGRFQGYNPVVSE